MHVPVWPLLILKKSIIFREMVEAMQDADAGIPLDTHMCHKENKTHKLCFTGEELYYV